MLCNLNEHSRQAKGNYIVSLAFMPGKANSNIVFPTRDTAEECSNHFIVGCPEFIRLVNAAQIKGFILIILNVRL
jgi:hypothetical protein